MDRHIRNKHTGKSAENFVEALSFTHQSTEVPLECEEVRTFALDFIVVSFFQEKNLTLAILTVVIKVIPVLVTEQNTTCITQVGTQK